MGKTDTADLESRLGELVRNSLGMSGITALTRLSAGAMQETWAFNAKNGDEITGLILRRAAYDDRSPANLPFALEAETIMAAKAAGVPTPRVYYVLKPGDGVGDGFVMERLLGETIPRKLLRDEAYATVRPRLARRFGEILASIHRTDLGRLSQLRVADAKGQLDYLEDRYREQNWPRPVFELAFKTLRTRCPPPPDRPVLVHGDFRNGNILIDQTDVVGVLDWEIAHVGDPLEDLAWLCIPPWRFGVLDKPVGGFGTRDELIAAYEHASARPVDRDRLAFWEAVGSLRWGVNCADMVETFRHHNRTVERGMIARRASENEIDLLAALLPLEK